MMWVIIAETYGFIDVMESLMQAARTEKHRHRYA